MKEIIVLDGKVYVREKANNIIVKDGCLYVCDYEPDSNPENWRTINGAHVHIDSEGNIDGGAGGKFNGNGAVPRSMFPDTDSAERRKQKKQAEARVKQQAEQHKKEVEAAREQRKQERAEAARYKQEREAQLKQERVEQKQKFDELRNSYWAEKDEKRKSNFHIPNKQQSVKVALYYRIDNGTHFICSITSRILSAISPLHRLPMLPSWVW